MRAFVRALVLPSLAMLAAACGDKKPSGPGPLSSASAPIASASVPSPPPASTAAVASAGGRIVPANAPLGSLDFVRSPRAGLAIVLAGDLAHATIVNEYTGEWRLVMPRREGEDIVIETPGAVLVLTGAGAERRLSVRFGEAAPRAFETILGPQSPPLVNAAYTVSGELLSPEALGPLQKLTVGKTTLIWRDGFLPPSPSLPPPTKLALGARAIVPSQPALRREGVCSIVGPTPTTDGPVAEVLNAALIAAQKTELDKLCRGRTEPTLIETSYAFIRFKGVNLEQGHEPDPTDVVGLDWLFRVTDARGSSLAETGYLVGMAKGEVVSLVSLLKPTGAAFLVNKALDPFAESRRTLVGIPKAERAALLHPATASLSLGPSTVDLVVATEPLGLLLEHHRVRLGPRSELFPAFVKGPLTQRLTAAVMVDY